MSVLKRTGSSDWGDMSTIMPVLETAISGTIGGGQGPDYRIDDPDIAYLLSSKYLALMAVDLLWEKAESAKSVLSACKLIFQSKYEYFDYVAKIFQKRILPEKDYES